MSAPHSTAADWIGQASLIFRRHLAGPAWIYYLCTAPFVAGLINFVASLSEGIVIPGEIARQSALMCLLFWLKAAGQTVYCRIALEELKGGRARWSAGELMHLAVISGAVQSIFLPAALVSAVFSVTFGVSSSMSQHLFVVAGEKQSGIRSSFRQSYALSMESVLLQHWFWGLAGILYVVVFVNLLIGVHFLPDALKTFFNIDTVFSMAPVSYLHSTFLAVVAGFTYLFVDPVIKLSYVLIHFNSVSRRTGADLLTRLAVIRAPKAVAAAGLVLLFGASAWGSTPALTPIERRMLDGPDDTRVSASALQDYYKPLMRIYVRGQLRRSDTAEVLWASDLLNEDWTTENVRLLKQRLVHLSRTDTESAGIDTSIHEAIRGVLRSDKYRWRVRHEPPPNRQAGPIGKLIEWLGRPVKAAVRAIDRFFTKVINWFFRRLYGARAPLPETVESSAVPYYLEVMVLVVVLILGSVLAIALLRHHKRFIRPAAPPAAAPNLEDERVDARALAQDEWMKLADELFRENKLPLALRAVFLATLSKLNDQQLIRFEPHKTNTAYVRELRRRVPADSRPASLHDMVGMFERVWYGGRAVTLDMFQSFRSLNRLVTGQAGSHGTEPTHAA